MTTQQLAELLGDYAEDNPEAEMRIVYHGYELPSLNLPISDVRYGPNHDVLIVAEEARR